MASNKYFIHLAYKGSQYQGWQRQANGLGIQEILEDKLSQMFKQEILLHACGRTDAGVHASQFFCHTTIKNDWDFDAVFRINKMLPTDICVYEFIPVSTSANAQLDVQYRTYDYYFHLQPDPFLSEVSTYYEIQHPDIEGMKKAVELIKPSTNFHSFCKQPNIHPSTICEINFVGLTYNANQNHFRFRITANRFLKAMVRMLVGHLIKIGQRKTSLAEFEQLLKEPQLNPRPLFAYPQGLFLSKVIYPYLERNRIPLAEGRKI